MIADIGSKAAGGARFFALLLSLLAPLPAQALDHVRIVTIQGVVQGQSRQVAFQTLCHARESLILKIIHFPNRKIVGDRPLRCSDWSDVQGADWWGLEDASAQCPDRTNQLMVINLLNDKVFDVHVWCRHHA